MTVPCSAKQVWFIVALFSANWASATDRHVGPAQTYTTISDAIAAANAGDEIFVEAGTYQETLYLDMELTITGIDGRDATFIVNDGQSESVYIDTWQVISISGFTFDGNYTGRHITVDGWGQLHFDSNRAINGVAPAGENGGSILFTGGNYWTSIANTQFQDNSTSKNGGHIAIMSNCDLSIYSSTFDGGSAELGGAVYLEWSNVFFDHVDFFDNDATTGREEPAH